MVILAAGGHHDRFSDRHRLFVHECLHVRARSVPARSPSSARRAAWISTSTPRATGGSAATTRPRSTACDRRSAPSASRSSRPTASASCSTRRSDFTQCLPAQVVAARSGGRARTITTVLIGPNVLPAGALRRRSVQVRGDLLDAARADREADPRRASTPWSIKGCHIVLEAVLVRNVSLPVQLQAAITNTLEAEQSALKMKFVIAQQEAEDQKQLGGDQKRSRSAHRSTPSAESASCEDPPRAAADAADHGAGSRRCKAPRRAGDRRLRAYRPVGVLTPVDLEVAGDRRDQKALAQSPNSKLVLMGQRWRPRGEDGARAGSPSSKRRRVAAAAVVRDGDDAPMNRRSRRAR